MGSEEKSDTVIGSLPEYAITEEMQAAHEEYKSCIPQQGSDSIKVSQRKKAASCVDKIKNGAAELSGVVKTLRHELSVRMEEINDLRKKIVLLENAANQQPIMRVNTTSKNTETKVTSYAEAAKKTYSVLIEPEDKQTTSEETERKVKEAINPVTSGIGVSQIRKTKDGGVIIQCTEKMDIEKIKLTIGAAENHQLRSRELIKNNPKLLIPRIDASVDNEDVALACTDRTEE